MGVVKTTLAQTKPPKKGVFHLVGLNSKCTIIAVNFKMAVFVHISRVKMAANPKIIFFVCIYIYVSVIHTKTSSGQYGHILHFYWHATCMANGTIGIIDAAASNWNTMLKQCNT